MAPLAASTRIRFEGDTRMRILALLVAAFASTAGCAPAPSAMPTASAPAASTPSASVSAEAPLQRAVAGPLGLEIPAGWHQRPGSLNPGGDETFLFMAPTDFASDCTETAQGGSCFIWPMEQLAPGGIVVAVRFHGRPGFEPPAGGDPITVAGLAARRFAGPADGACRGIGGTDLVEVWLPAFAGGNGIYSIDACSSGQAAGTAEFAAILASVSFTRDAPSS
jgi:hypothetical protein